MTAYIGVEALSKVLKTVNAKKTSYVIFGYNGLITLRYLKGL